MLDILGNMEERQRELQAKLDEIVIEESTAGGEVSIKMTANKRLVDISIDSDFVSQNDSEALEDVLLVAFNNALKAAEAKSEAELQNQINDILPGGLGNLFGS